MTDFKRIRRMTGAAIVGFISLGCAQVDGTTGGELDPSAGGAGQRGVGGTIDDGSAWLEPLQFAKSGRRLQALGYIAEGAEQFRSLHDSLLGFDCEFVPDEIGVGLHCVPRKQAELVFLDSSCTTPALRDFSYSTQIGDWISARDALVPDSENCPGASALHRDTFEIAEEIYPEGIYPAIPPVYERTSGQCQPALVGKSSPSVRRLVAHADNELVRAERVNVDVGGGLRLTRLVAEDAAVLSIGVTNAQQTACALQPDGECVPGVLAERAAGNFFFALDTACQQPAWVSPYPHSCGPPQLAREGTSAGDFFLHRIEAPAQVFARTPVYLESGQQVAPPAFSCEPAMVGELSAFTIGEDVTGSFPAAQRLRLGSGALHVDWFVKQVGARVVPLAHVPELPQFINDAGEACSVVPGVDGSLRCAALEPSPVEAGYWQDAACTRRLYSSDPLSVPASRLHVGEYDQSGTRLIGLYDLEAYQGAVYAYQNGGCSPDVAEVPVFARGRRTELAALPLVLEMPL
jgi:hypothetical protein